jgi:GDP-L-fucose synthase
MKSFLTESIADAAWWRGKRVVVTGGSGFIGSHVVERLLPLCDRIVVPTRQEGVPEKLQHLEGEVELLEGDLREAVFAQRACRGADVVLMLAAAVGGIKVNSAHHASMFRDNMSVFMTTLEAARQMGVGRILVTGSACVYPRVCDIPTPESEGFRDRPEATNEGYGWAKRMQEYLGEAYSREFAMSVAVARPYNAYGPRDDFNEETSHVIPALIRKAFDPEVDELVVWGSGSQSRSFLHVTDFADGLIRICERSTDAQPTNVGADEETTIGEVAQLVARFAGTKKRVVFDISEPEGQPRRHCDTRRLEKVFEFRARVPLNEGLRQTVEYYREKVLVAA